MYKSPNIKHNNYRTITTEQSRVFRLEIKAVKYTILFGAEFLVPAARRVVPWGLSFAARKYDQYVFPH